MQSKSEIEIALSMYVILCSVDKRQPTIQSAEY